VIGENLAGSLFVRAWGLLVLVVAVRGLLHRDKAASAGARAHQRLSRVAPFLYWLPGSQRVATSLGVWRVITPILSIVGIVFGLILVVTGGSF
jgi:hypothetical protein